MRAALVALMLLAGGCSRQAAPSADEQALAAEQRATERKTLDDLRAAQAAVPPAAPARVAENGQAGSTAAP